jgi:hypothetical protein
LVLPLLRPIVVVQPSRSLGFAPGSVHMRLVVDKVEYRFLSSYEIRLFSGLVILSSDNDS